LTGVWLDANNRLWRAVILQALLDASGFGRSVNPSWPEWKHEKVRDDALKWLLYNEKDFPSVCTFATVPEESVRKLARLLEKGDEQAKLLLLEWRDIFAKQLRESKNELEI
jgi:hypothetical protein